MASHGRVFIAIAAVSLLTATALGAYASHGMSAAPAPAVDAVRTAVQFQFHHGLALLAVVWLEERLAPRWVTAAGWLLVAGTLLFCGGIYGSRLLGIDELGRVAPLGGMTLMAGWATLAAAALISGRRVS